MKLQETQISGSETGGSAVCSVGRAAAALVWTSENNSVTLSSENE